MKHKRVNPRLYKGFRDIFAGDLIQRRQMIDVIRQVYETYGFVPLETPSIEYVEVLGKNLPESDLPDGGIFSWQNDEGEYLALRYDLTAPLARVVAQYQDLKRPYRRYQVGNVYRYEKPGPGRYREFMQFDFDVVGANSMLADAEACMVICDALEALGIRKGDYIIRMNNRKILNGVLETLGLSSFSRTVRADEKGASAERAFTSMDILRAIDKLDRVGMDGMRDLLTDGRMDPTGDFMPGLSLDDREVAGIEAYLNVASESRAEYCREMEQIVGDSAEGKEGVLELRQIDSALTTAGYSVERVKFDPTIVRGLAYYTGPVYEAELTFEVVDENRVKKSFGSVFGGGRYDDLVERFTGQKVPATGGSIGVDRLLAALKHLGKVEARTSTADVLVTVMDKSKYADYIQLAQELRASGVNTELFMGSGNIGKQLKYADYHNISVAVIAGSDEFERGTCQVKDLALGRELSAGIEDNEQWRAERPAQFEVKREELIGRVKRILEADQTNL